VHCHILPGVDDGSIHMEMTKKLLHMEMENGVDTILFTPHFKRGKSRFNNEKLLQVFEEVKKEALQINPEFKLFLGEELYYDHSLCSALEEGKALKLNGTNYVLVEFSPEVEYKTIHKACQSLTMAGVSPVLAHIERYPALISKEDHLIEIHEMGVYYQMNVTSIMGSNLSGRMYKQKKLLADGWIDFIASDSHDDKNRHPKFKKAWKELLRLCDDEMIERIMWKNPAKLLAGKDIDL
jgi:protein-tyrosine phosphatase